jgi:hypothetical protein
MATQFVIPATAKIQSHLKITIGLEKDNALLYEVKIEKYGMEIPQYFVKLFCLKQDEDGVWIGNINHRIYGSNLNAFLGSFEKYCASNITHTQNDGRRIVYTFSINEIMSGGLNYDQYFQDELTVEFDEEKIIFFLDGQHIPDVFEEIQKSLELSGVKADNSFNSRIFVFNIEGFFNVKDLVKSVFAYLGDNGYKIVNIEAMVYSIDLRVDGSKDEIIKISEFIDFVGNIEFSRNRIISIAGLLDRSIALLHD